MAIELGSQGKSLAQIAAACGVSRKTVYEWMRAHPSFGDAIAHARDLSLAWWEEQAHIGMWETPEGARLNPQLWSRSMAARFPDDYRESKKLEHAGPNGGPVQTQVIITTGVPVDGFEDLA